MLSLWNGSVSSTSFQITILSIEADKVFLRWNWMHGFISCLPDKVEYLTPWNSCVQKYYLASQLCSLQNWCGKKGQSVCAMMLKGQLELAHQPNHVKEMLFLPLHKLVSWVSEIQDKLILFLQHCFLPHFHLQILKNCLALLGLEKRFDF